MKKFFFIIGAPGSGKTTDAELIASKNRTTIAHYSTGNLLREEVDSGSNLGKTIDSFVSKGNLCPLNIVLDTVIKALKKSTKNVIIIDGFPRSEEQMVEFHALVDHEKDIQLTSVIEVVVSEEVARDRVLGRARGADDNNDVFNNRMKVYTEPLTIIQDFYESRNLLKKIDGERSIEEIVDEMEIYIKSLI
ncbi:MAG TPA: adenylate kinase [Sulfuricurvum sp.]|nr:adenylate kinase [Sulfuricurvum sp.]